MTRNVRTEPELLAPAGGPDALLAALNNGADAVYLGVESFNARRGAENFTLETLPEATRLAHLRGARVYLTANVLVMAEETREALDLLDEAWAAGVDAVILQDLGLASLAASELPHVRLHASTQLNAHNAATVAELARRGFARVTLARETPVSAMAGLAAAADVEIEAFVHGALCVSYSGQCLMSSMIGGRSANRGRCAQPCRLTYGLLDARSQPKAAPGPHLLSPKDLCGLDMLPALIGAGVGALKIEGRMKAPEYVALVTGVYRAALDRALSDPEGFEVTDAERSILAEAFNRGFSSAYLDGIRDDRMMSYSRPNNRGVPVGRVAKVLGGDVYVSLDTALDQADTVEFWTSRGRFAQKAGELRLSGRPVGVAPAGKTVTMRAEKSLSAGDRVFRVANAALEEAARRTFATRAGTRPIPLDVAVSVVVGRPVSVEVRHGEFVGQASGPVVEAARTKAITAEEITEHVGRMGGTLFEPGAFDIELSPGAGLGYSVLHHARRDAIAALEDAMLAGWSKREPVHPKPRALPKGVTVTEVPDIVVRTDDPAIARACLAAGAQRAIVPAWAYDATDAETPAGGVWVELPRIAHDAEVGALVDTARAAGRIVAGNLGLLAAVGGLDEPLAAEAHWGLNAANAYTVEALAESGAGFVWLSPELSGRQVAAVVKQARVPVGIALYGRQEVMVTEHCVLMSAGPCDQRCGTCPRRQGWYALKDAKGYAFPVMSDPSGRSHIFNSVPLDLTRALAEIVEAGVSAVRLDFTVEHLQEAQHITRLAREALVAVASGKAPKEGLARQQGTSGHFFRGVR